jgi:hypothetical protein
MRKRRLLQEREQTPNGNNFIKAVESLSQIVVVGEDFEGFLRNREWRMAA